MSDPTDKHLPDDQELDDYLRGGSAVSRQYRELGSADVPSELDRLVLRQAQEAVKVRPAKSRTWLRWSGPLALAASAVLVVSIVIESGVHKETTISAPASAPAEPQIFRENAPASGIAQDQAMADQAMADQAMEDDASVVDMAPVVPEQPAAEFAPEPAPAAAEEPARRNSKKSAAEETLRPAPPPVAAPAPAPVAAPQSQVPEPIAKIELPESDAERRRARVETISQNGAIAPSVTTARNRRLSGDHESASVVQDLLREPSQVAGPRNSVAVPANASDAEQEAEPRIYTDPQQWLSDIRELRKQDKHEEADREWRRFRSVFPNYSVDASDPARSRVR